MSQYVKRSATAIDCPTCAGPGGAKGRVTVVMPSGAYSTATCQDCNGYGFRENCVDPDCRYCNAANAGAQPAAPMFEWTRADVWA